VAAPVSLDGVRDLAARFDYFLVDQFGVLHDGQQPYLGAPEALLALKRAGKRVVLLSNSGKRSAPNEARLVALGFARESWDIFLSSGEIAWSLLDKQLRERPGAALRCLLISRDNDRSAVEGLPLTLTDSGADADIILLSASEADRLELDDYRRLLEPAAVRGITCYCTNPDKTMLTRLGPRPGAGRIAELYEEMGGPVVWIGKPFPEIYDTALTLLGHPSRERVVCVGDSIEHDIAGGAGAGLATALVETGILASMPAERKLELFQQHAAVPDFILGAFSW